MVALEPNPKLDHLCRFLNTVRGTDKVFMMVQYTSKILIWYLKKQNTSSTFAQRIQNIASPVSDFRILLRYYGLIPMLQWILYSEKHPSKNMKIKWLTRLQNIMNVCYYPLEHIYWLGAHDIIPLTEEQRNKAGMWSCRFWMAYVILYFIQLKEEYTDAKKEIKKIKTKLTTTDISESSKKDALNRLQKLKTERMDWFVNLIINTAYLPLTVHWSLESSTFPDIGVGICGTIAALGQCYASWKSTA